jgi:uncharacterized membrane protein
LTKLDKIEERLESMDKKFKTVDTEINSCKQRLNTLEHSAFSGLFSTTVCSSIAKNNRLFSKL